MVAASAVPIATVRPEPPPSRAPERQVVERALPSGLGAPCSVGTPGCGHNGKVAVVRMPDREWLPRSDPREVCKPLNVSSGPLGQHVSAACVEGGILVVQRTCIVCRIGGWESLLGVVAWMTPEQLEEAQRLAGFPAPPLTSERAWTYAIDQAAANARTP